MAPQPHLQPAASNDPHLVYPSLWRTAEEETVFLITTCKLSLQEVIRQYTGTTPEHAELQDAINAIYSFNLKHAK